LVNGSAPGCAKIEREDGDATLSFAKGTEMERSEVEMVSGCHEERGQIYTDNTVLMICSLCSKGQESNSASNSRAVPFSVLGGLKTGQGRASA
jgi:hypothetical protein